MKETDLGEELSHMTKKAAAIAASGELQGNEFGDPAPVCKVGYVAATAR